MNVQEIEFPQEDRYDLQTIQNTKVKNPVKENIAFAIANDGKRLYYQKGQENIHLHVGKCLKKYLFFGNITLRFGRFEELVSHSRVRLHRLMVPFPCLTNKHDGPFFYYCKVYVERDFIDEHVELLHLYKHGKNQRISRSFVFPKLLESLDVKFPAWS